MKLFSFFKAIRDLLWLKFFAKCQYCNCKALQPTTMFKAENGYNVLCENCGENNYFKVK